jgi:hypothetical protein
MAVGLLCRLFLYGCPIHQASSLETIYLTLGLLSVKVDAWYLDLWVKWLGFPNISDMLANLPSPGELLFKIQKAYFRTYPMFPGKIPGNLMAMCINISDMFAANY